MALYSVVSFSGTNSDWLIYKYPNTEFNSKSKLVVSTGQVAIIVHNGKIERICEEGNYVMNSELLPIVKTFVKGVHGGKNPYPIEVYFINKRLKLDLLWGTTDPVSILDPIYKIQLRVRARGQMGIKLVNYQYFLQTLVGTLMQGSYIDFDIICNYFRGSLNQKIKKVLSSFIISNKITFFEIDTRIDEIQSEFESAMKDEVTKFGFEIASLSIESINVPEDDLRKLNEILHKKAEYEQLGDTVYRTTRGYDVLEEGAKNNNAAGAFMGVGLGVNMANNASSTIIPPSASSDSTEVKCPHCGNVIPRTAKFCPHCGQKMMAHCPKCGTQVLPGAKFCGECGEKLVKEEE